MLVRRPSDLKMCLRQVGLKNLERMPPHQPPHLFVPSMAQRPSGLWSSAEVPARAPVPELPEGMLFVVGEPPSDLDAIYVAPESEALGLAPVGLPTIGRLLADLPFEPAMMALSVISASVWFAGHDQSKHLSLAEDVFGTGRPIFEKLREFVAEGPNHLIFNEQHLTVLMRLLVSGASSDDDGMRELTDQEVDSLLMALVGIASTISRGDAVTDPGAPADWVPFLVRSGLYFDKSNLGSDQGRAHALFVDLFGQVDPGGHCWCDLSTWMAEDLTSLQEQLGFGYAAGALTKAFDDDASLVERKIAMVIDGLLAEQLPTETTPKLVAAISADRAELAEHFAAAGETLDHIIWDRTPFEQRPFLRLRDGRMILMSPRFLYSWAGEGFYYRLLDSANRRNTSGCSISHRFTGFHGELMEDYVLALTEDSHREQIRAGAATVSSEQKYIGEDGSESLSPDLTIAYGTELATIEVTGGRPARRARVLSEPEEMLQVIRRVIGKMEELDGAITDIFSARVSIDGIHLALLERVWPVIVVPSTILQSEMLWNHIEAEAPLLFDDPRVQPPTLFSIEDYEHALGIVEQGQGLPWLLGARLNSVYKTMPPSHFFNLRNLDADRPRYLDKHMRQAGDEAVDQLFPGRSRGETADA